MRAFYRTADRAATHDNPLRSQFYVREHSIGGNRSWTQEGFLVCHDVPITRIGELIYAGGEIPGVVAGSDGLVRVTRDESEVFSVDTIASFNGKPVTDDHPPDGVSPANWRKLSVGVVQSPRRGEGEFREFIVADLVIQDADAIAKVEAGKREVSCGYDALYEQVEPGRAKQSQIIGNHVALVRQGRCGVRCAIGDNHMTTKAAAVVRTNDKKSVQVVPRIRAKARDKALAALSILRGLRPTRDEEGELGSALETIATAVANGELDGQVASDPDGMGVTVVVNVGSGDPVIEKEGDEPVAATADEDDPLAEIKAMLTAIGERLDKLEKRDDPPASTDGKTITGDSAGLAAAFAETIASAEVLAPGIGIPTFDAKLAPNATEDAMCGLRRRALTAAFRDRKEVVQPFAHLFNDRAAPNFDIMSCDAVTTVFNGATVLAARANNGRSVTADQSRTTVTVPTPAEMNARNRDFWKTRGHA